MPDKSIAPKKRIQQSSSSAWEEVPPSSKKASSDTPGSEAHIWRSRGSSRKTTEDRPASKVRSGSSRRTVLTMPARQSAAWAGIKDESDATWGAHKDASDSAGDARPKGPSGHRPGQAPAPLTSSRRQRLRTQVRSSRMKTKRWTTLMLVQLVVTCQASTTSKPRKESAPPHSSKRAWEGRAMLPKKREKGAVLHGTDGPAQGSAR